MSRLPQPGADDGSWGSVLNDFLAQSHNSDGTLKNNIVTGAQLASSAVTGSSLAASGGSDGQVLTKNSGTSAGLSWSTVSGSSGPVNDATTTTKGIVQLAGDLSGSAAAPTVPGLTNKLDASKVGTANGVASLDGTGKVPTSQLPASSGAVTSVAGRTGAVTLTESDVANLSSDLTSKVANSTVTTKGDLLGATGSAALTRLGVGSDGQVLTADSSQNTGLAWTTSPTGTAPTLANIPSGSTITVAYTGSSWPARPTSRTDIIVQWKGPDPSPPIVSSGMGGMLDNVDIRFVTPS